MHAESVIDQGIPEGYTLWVENDCISNIPKGARSPPAGRMWAYYLFAKYGPNGKPAQHRRVIVIVEETTRRKTDALLERLCELPRVEVFG